MEHVHWPTVAVLASGRRETPRSANENCIATVEM